jgi:large subunit ribosomal protein L9
MQVILIKEVESLGQAGQTVTVKNGYARNYLIPQGLAMIASKSNLTLIENQLKAVELKEAKSRKNLESLANELNKIKLSFSLKAGEDEKLFGSVTSQMISDSCNELGFTVNKKEIHIEEPIKTLGNHKVTVKLNSEIEAKIKIKVKALDE